MSTQLQRTDSTTVLAAPGTFTAVSWTPPETMDVDEWLSAMADIKRAQQAVMWWIGDGLAFGERKYGEMYSQAMDATELEYQTLRNAAYVSSKVELSRRRDNLSWAHHAEVAAFEPDEQDALLDAAAKDGLTREQFRQTVRAYKKELKRLALASSAKTPAPMVGGSEYAVNEVYHGDVRDVVLPPESIGLVFTDPPYHDEYLDLYAALGTLAMASLKDGGFLLTYCGKMFLPEVVTALTEAGLTYHWQFAVFHPFSQSKVNKVHVFENWRPILAFRKGEGQQREWVQDVVRGERNKEGHDWQQDMQAPAQYIPVFADSGDIVLDPFVGGGTTVLACRDIEQPFLAFDIDEQNVQLVRAQLGK